MSHIQFDSTEAIFEDLSAVTPFSIRFGKQFGVCMKKWKGPLPKGTSC